MEQEYLELKEYIISKCLHFSIEVEGKSKNLGNDASYLFDLRELVLHPYYGKLAAKLIWDKIRKYEIRLLFGQGVGSIPLITLVQQAAKEIDNIDVEILICREARKKTNRQRLVEGIRPTTVPRAMFIDDLTNTGNTYRKSIKALQEENINLRIMGAAGILDFWSIQGTRQLAVQNNAIEYLFKRHDLGLSRVTPDKPLLGVKKYNVLTSNTYLEMDLKSPAVIDNNIVYWATDTQNVYAMNTDTGEILWQFTSPDQEDWQRKGIINKLLIDDTGVYFNTYNGIAFKLEKTTGNVLWAVKAGRWLHSSSTISQDGTKIFLSTESRNQTDTSHIL
jgi:orotate phosphoribosyltransferase